MNEPTDFGTWSTTGGVIPNEKQTDIAIQTQTVPSYPTSILDVPVSRRNFLIGSGILTALFMAASAEAEVVDAGFVEPKPMVESEELRMPYEISVEHDPSRIRSLNSFKLDSFLISTDSVGIENVEVLPNGVTKIEIAENFEFMTTQALTQVLEFCGGINLREAGVESQEVLISKLKNIFEIVGGGLSSQFAIGGRILGIQEFNGGIAESSKY